MTITLLANNIFLRDFVNKKTQNKNKQLLGGGFNPFEKYESNWIISLGTGENSKYLKPPPRLPQKTQDFPMELGSPNHPKYHCCQCQGCQRAVPH